MSVQLAVHHKIVAGNRVATVAVDRAEAQPHLRALGQRDTRDRHSTSGHAPHDRCRGLQPDHLLHESRYAARVLAKVVAQVGAAGQLEHRGADGRGDGVQSGEYEYERQSQGLGIGERIVAVQEL